MNKKIIGAIVILVIVVGIIVTSIFGFNLDLKYIKHKEIDIRISQEFDNKEIKNIAKEVLDKKNVEVSKVELYQDMVSIAVEDITDEELQNLNDKINEKYGISNTVDDINVTGVSNKKLLDIVKPYITPAIISFILIEVYLLIYLILYKKYGKEVKEINNAKCMLELFVATIVFELLYISAISITRLPLNEYTISIGVLVFTIPSIVKFLK